MPHWFIIRNGKENGPFESEKLKGFAANGKLKPDDLVRRADQTSARKAADIKGLLRSQPIVAPSETSATAIRDDVDSPGAAGEADSSKPEAKESFSTQAKASAALFAETAVKQAKLKMLTSVELPAVDYQIGLTSIKHNLGKDLFGKEYAEIEKTDETIASLKQAQNDSAPSTLADRMRGAANGAVRMAKAESLALRRKSLVTGLGTLVRQSDIIDHDQAIAEHLSRANQICEDIARLQVELEHSSRQGGFLGPRKTLAVSLAVVSLLIIVVMWGRGGSGSSSNSATAVATMGAANVLAELDNEMKAARNKARQVEQELQQTRLEGAKRSELQKEQQRLAIEEARLASALESQRQREKQQEEQLRRNIESTVQLENEQKSRHDFANRLYSSISFDPAQRIRLSKSLKDAGATLELRGPEYTTLQMLHAKKDWLGLTNILSRNDYGTHDSLPQVTLIQRAFDNGFNRTELFALLKVARELPVSQYQYPRLQAISFPLSGDLSFQYNTGVSLYAEFELHPDGIGYLTKWSPLMGHSIFYIQRSADDHAHLQRILNRVGEERSSLKKKVEIGEINEEAMEIRMTAAMRRAYDEASAWALEQ